MKHQTANPTTLTDFAAWELEAYADGVEVPHLAQFFAAHPAVAAAWQQEQQSLTQLQTALYRFDCPAPTVIQDYHWQHLLHAEQATVRTHVALCPHCQQELRQLRTFLIPEQHTTVVQPTAVEPTGGWRAQLQDAVDHLRIVVANLVTPPTAQFAGVALRSAAAQPAADALVPRSLLLEAEEMDISLLLQKEAAGTILLSGQLLSVTPLPQSMVMLTPQASDATPATAQVDATGNFTFQQLRPGLYQLQITLDDKLIIAPMLSFQ